MLSGKTAHTCRGFAGSSWWVGEGSLGADCHDRWSPNTLLHSSPDEVCCHLQAPAALPVPDPLSPVVKVVTGVPYLVNYVMLGARFASTGGSLILPGMAA